MAIFVLLNVDLLKVHMVLSTAYTTLGLLISGSLFINAETAGSFYHLGEMYEHGLGVPIDTKIAKHYYKKGAEKGSIKAQKRLENCCCTL